MMEDIYFMVFIYHYAHHSYCLCVFMLLWCCDEGEGGSVIHC